MYLWRPCLAEPPLCTYQDLKTSLTIDDLADLHEALDLKEAIQEHARKSRERN